MHIHAGYTIIRTVVQPDGDLVQLTNLKEDAVVVRIFLLNIHKFVV